jgi:dihydrofolate synthase/folylpolyglutamate synthase
MTSYHDTIAWLESRHRSTGQRSLAAMREACERLGYPERTLRCVHVAGTNGKGSVCTKIAKGFELAGTKVGLFTSPHIFSFCERIQVQGIPISQEGVVDGVAAIRRRCSDDLSFFEITTLLAFEWFRQHGVQMAVFETGLGGRLDATNVCHPSLCIITSINFDHVIELGNTIEQITAEKAGIIKRAVPLLLGPRVSLQAVMKSAPFTLLQQHGETPIIHQVTGTWADFDEENSALAAKAMALLDLPLHCIEKAVLVRPPCRFQQFLVPEQGDSVPVVLDVAHNPDGIQRLLMKTRATFPNSLVCFLMAVCRNKDIASMARLIKETAAIVICTQSSSWRAMAAEELAAHIRNTGVEAIAAVEPSTAFRLAMGQAKARKIPLVITGTFFLMESVHNLLTDTAGVIKNHQ